MKVVVHPADRGGCGHYRMIYPAQTLAAQGYDVHLRYDHTYPVVRTRSAFGAGEALGLADLRAFRREYERAVADVSHAQRRGLPSTPIERRWTDRLREVMDETGRAQLEGADVVVFQRVLSRERFEVMCAVQQAGAAVVVEIDDDFHAIHKLNLAWKFTNPLRDPDHNRDWLARACRQADLVTVTTPALAERYGPNAHVVPNYVPESYLNIKPGVVDGLLPRPDGLLVGWSGSLATHPGDLQVCGDGVLRALNAKAAKFHVIGTGVGVKDALGLAKEPTATGWQPIDVYPEALSQLDVGIVPLLASNFNEAKSWLKGLEMAAVGVPFVASPTGPYRALFAEGAGLPAEYADDWRAKLLELISHKDMYAEVGRTAAMSLTYERNAWRWMEAWGRALEHRRATHTKAVTV